jgi:gamma-D-glutamyl-L-lysine dipeptidyl-peptidase
LQHLVTGLVMQPLVIDNFLIFMKIFDNSRFYFGAIILTVLIFSQIGCKVKSGKNLQKEIDSISIAHVPDHRIGICNVIADTSDVRRIVLSGETTDPIFKVDLFNTLDKDGIKFIDSIIVLPDTISNEYFTGLVTLSVINLRKEPDHASELVSQARLGTPVSILKSSGSWVLIQTPDKYIAWAEAFSVQPMKSSEMRAWRKYERVIYLENTGWIYSSPDETGVTGDIVAGSILQKDGESGKYAKVILPDGRKGYVYSRSIMDLKTWESGSLGDPESICKRASSMLGIPYLWGGTSAKGADCSGFVQTVFFINGIILQRDASLQALHGEPVDLSGNFRNLLPGDLLFFGPTRNGKQRVTHVAIYKGDMDYINSSGMVQINSLDSTQSDFNGARFKLLLMARRISGVKNDFGIVSVKDHPWY